MKNNENTQDQPALKDVFKDDFYVGVALSLNQIFGNEPNATTLIGNKELCGIRGLKGHVQKRAKRHVSLVHGRPVLAAVPGAVQGEVSKREEGRVRPRRDPDHELIAAVGADGLPDTFGRCPGTQAQHSGGNRRPKGGGLPLRQVARRVYHRSSILGSSARCGGV